MQAGARYNRFWIDADFGNNLPFYPLPFDRTRNDNGSLTGTFGIVYTPDARLTLTASLSTGFRSPNVDDLGKIFDSAPGVVVVPNPDLNAEYAYNAEVGLVKVFGERFRLDISGYYTLLDNALVRRDFTLDGLDSIEYDGELSRVQAVQNAASATVYGVQAGAELKIGKGVSVISRFNYQDGEEELDDGTVTPPRHVAPWFGVTTVRYAGKNVEVRLYAAYNGEVGFEDLGSDLKDTPDLFAKDDQGNPYSPGWMTLNMKASVSVSESLTVSGGLENILNKRYRPYASSISAAGRNVILSLRGKF
jgi:hemoglobin/transferrin/lactoferrin receptor protein